MKKYNQIFNKPVLKKYRRNLRNSLTPAEATLWKYLKNRQLDNRRFRRQFSAGNYILDFYCPAEKLAVELDGAEHFTASGSQYDDDRTKYLNSIGIKVIRFENVEVFENIEWILREIRKDFGR